MQIAREFVRDLLIGIVGGCMGAMLCNLLIVGIGVWAALRKGAESEDRKMRE